VGDAPSSDAARGVDNTLDRAMTEPSEEPTTAEPKPKKRPLLVHIPNERELPPPSTFTMLRLARLNDHVQLAFGYADLTVKWQSEVRDGKEVVVLPGKLTHHFIISMDTLILMQTEITRLLRRLADEGVVEAVEPGGGAGEDELEVTDE
jgi:hypothetical protein